MSVLNPNWHYASAEESRKPNYLRNKFNRIRKAQRDAEAAQKKADADASKVVTAIPKRKQT